MAAAAVCLSCPTSGPQYAGPGLLRTSQQLKFQPDFPTRMEKKDGSDIVASALFLRPLGAWTKSRQSLNCYRLLSRCTVPGTAPRCKTQVGASEPAFAAFFSSEATKATITLIAAELQSCSHPPPALQMTVRGPGEAASWALCRLRRPRLGSPPLKISPFNPEAQAWEETEQEIPTWVSLMAASHCWRKALWPLPCSGACDDISGSIIPTGRVALGASLVKTPGWKPGGSEFQFCPVG